MLVQREPTGSNNQMSSDVSVPEQKKRAAQLSRDVKAACFDIGRIALHVGNAVPVVNNCMRDGDIHDGQSM